MKTENYIKRIEKKYGVSEIELNEKLKTVKFNECGQPIDLTQNEFDFYNDLQRRLDKYVVEELDCPHAVPSDNGGSECYFNCFMYNKNCEFKSNVKFKLLR